MKGLSMSSLRAPLRAVAVPGAPGACDSLRTAPGRVTHPALSFCLWLVVLVTICCACASTPQATPSAPPPPPAPVKDAPVPVIAPAGTPEWPPAPLKPLKKPLGDGQEGRWRAVSDLVQHNPDAPPLMFQTTLRHFKQKPGRKPGNTLYEVEVLVWDPEQVDLRLMAGPREPEAPLKKRGKGLIPRDPEVMPRLLAAFNGGWRTQDAKTSGIKWDGVTGPPTRGEPRDRDHRR